MTRSDPDDLLIVGAGIIGLMIAWEAKRRWPRIDVTVIDRNVAGTDSGASFYSPGIQLAYGRNETERSYADYSIREWEKYFKQWNWRPGRVVGLNWLGRCDSRIMQQSTRNLEPNGVAERSLLGGPIQELVEGVVIPDQCSYDPAAPIVERMCRELSQLGVQFVEGEEVNSIAGSSPIKVESQNSVFYAHTVLACMGPWFPSSPIAESHSPNCSVRVKKVMAFDLSLPVDEQSEAVALADDYAFLIPQVERGCWLFSFGSEQWDVQPNPRELVTDDRDLQKAKSILLKYMDINDAQIGPARVFCDAYTDSGLPMIEFSKISSSVLFVGACGGNGFRFAPAIANEVLSKVMGTQECNFCPRA